MSAQSDNQLDENSGPKNIPGSNDSGSSNPRDSLPASNSDHDKRGTISTYIIQTVYILWLAPILTLLIFNFRTHIVGASAWCPRKNCHAGIFNPVMSTPIENLRRFDKRDHNLLGALQIVAKIIEIWFTLIVAALVSRLTFLLAKKKSGLTIGLTARQFNFADLRGTFESLLWTSDAEQDLPGTWKAIKSILGRLWKATKSVPGSLWKATKLIFGRLCKARKSIVTEQPPITEQPPDTEQPHVTEQPSDTEHRPWLIYGFIAFTAILSVMCNLMGPAVAVLVLPTLKWIDTRPVGDLNFVSIGAGEPPQMAPDWENDRYFSSNTYCTEDDFKNLTFSCAADPYASKLDSWIGTYIAAGDYIDGLTQEWSVKFRVNQTFSAPVLGSVSDQHSSAITWWTPSRQVLSSLDDDRTMVEMISQGYSDPEMDGFYSEGIRNQLPLDSPDTYVNYNNSLRLTLQRKGPVLGAIVQMHWENNVSRAWTSKIDNSRSVRCFSYYNLLYAPFYETLGATWTSSGNFTKCVKVGSGWNKRNKELNFTIVGEHNYTTNVTSPGVEFSIYSSDRAQFFEDGEYPFWLPPDCLQAGQVPTTVICNWDRLFYTSPDENLYNRTQNVISIEMSTRQANTNGIDGRFTRFTVDFVALLGFASYELDASPLTNPMVLATTQSLPPTGSPIHIDPAWMLAAWTVDNKGTLAPNRTATTEALRTMKRFSTSTESGGEDEDTSGLFRHLSYISLLPVTQALSMIDYNTTSHGTTKAALAFAIRREDCPHLARTARMYVWAYGLNSRTSYFGATVAILGTLVVLLQIWLGFKDRTKGPSLEQLLLAALEYVHKEQARAIRTDDKFDVVRRGPPPLQVTELSKGQFSFEKREAIKPTDPTV
jgi:hypothetical protein